MQIPGINQKRPGTFFFHEMEKAVVFAEKNFKLLSLMKSFYPVYFVFRSGTLACRGIRAFEWMDS